MAVQVKAEHERQRRQRPKRQGRPRPTVVTGYLMGDDSTQHKPKGKKMGELGPALLGAFSLCPIP